MTYLFRVSQKLWVVKSTANPETMPFNSIEAAADHLEANGIADESIDAALVDMTAHETSRAVFNESGIFTDSDNEKSNEQFGSS